MDKRELTNVLKREKAKIRVLLSDDSLLFYLISGTEFKTSVYRLHAQII